MNDEQQKIAIAEACGYVWYRIPNNRFGDCIFRCLFLPALHEYEGQSECWLVRADGSEKMCNMGYMASEGRIPDYLNDLNAMHEAEKLLTIEQQTIYLQLLSRQMFFVCHATSRQRAEAFLKTLNLWKD